MDMKSGATLAVMAIFASACATASSPPPDGPTMAACDRAQNAGAADESYPQSADDYMEMLDCLGHGDPDIRDGFAYTRLTDALRNRAPDHATRRAVGARLMKICKGMGTRTVF